GASACAVPPRLLANGGGATTRGRSGATAPPRQRYRPRHQRPGGRWRPGWPPAAPRPGRGRAAGAGGAGPGPPSSEASAAAAAGAGAGATAPAGAAGIEFECVGAGAGAAGWTLPTGAAAPVPPPLLTAPTFGSAR